METALVRYATWFLIFAIAGAITRLILLPSIFLSVPKAGTIIAERTLSVAKFRKMIKHGEEVAAADELTFLVAAGCVVDQRRAAGDAHIGVALAVASAAVVVEQPRKTLAPV